MRTFCRPHDSLSMSYGGAGHVDENAQLAGVRLGQVTIFSPGTEISESASAPFTEIVSPA